MISERNLWRFQLALLLAALALAALYWFGYRTLGHWERSLDKPAAEAWKKLLAAAQGKPQIRALTPGALLASVQQMQQAATLLQEAGRAAQARIELDEALRAKMAEEFQLLEFERSRLQVSAELRKAAEQKRVALADGVLKGLPEFDRELPQPALLWVQLAFARHLLSAAIAAEPRLVQSLAVLPVKFHPGADGQQVVLQELPFQLVLSGPPSNLVRFLASLPLRDAELTAAGLPALPDKSQVLFLDRLILKNSSPHPTETTLEVIATGFCLPLKPEANPARPGRETSRAAGARPPAQFAAPRPGPTAATRPANRGWSGRVAEPCPDRPHPEQSPS